jgi:NADH-quinone oxidoreductase subunit J
MALDIEGTGSIILLVATVVFTVLAIELRDLVRASICLGIGSGILAGVFFVLGAPIAAVFELSVCAGLVTVLLLSSIGMIDRKEEII